MQEVKKIVIIGPESTGKSTLSKQLAGHYHTLWCPEYAREFLLLHGIHYSYNDLLTIAKGQLLLEEKYLAEVNERMTVNKDASPLLFVDTDMYVMKVWCEYVFDNCHQYILEKVVSSKCSLYLLCNIDLPWVKDELREYPDLESREELFHMYKDILVNQKVPWVEVTGNYAQRFTIAKNAVDAIINL